MNFENILKENMKKMLSTCPFCQTESIRIPKTIRENNQLKKEYYCLNCNRKWETPHSF